MPLTKAMISSAETVMPSLRTMKALGTSPANCVRFPYDCTEFHGWVLVEYVFEFSWVDAVVFGFDEFFFAVSNVEVAVLIHACDVAC